jgi:hypothetical protein
MTRDHASTTVVRGVAPRAGDDRVGLILRTLARPAPAPPAAARWRSRIVRAMGRRADAPVAVDDGGRVALAPIARAGALDALTLSDARAIVLVHGDEVTPWEAQEAVERLERRCPWVEGFAVAGPRDRRGLDECVSGILRQAGADGVAPGPAERWRVRSASAASRPPSPK